MSKVHFFSLFSLKENHEIEGITNCEITKCGDLLYLQWFSLFSYTVMVQEDLNVRRVCFVITQKAGPLFFLPSRLFQLPQVHSRQVCLYTYICRQIHTWAYLTINWMGVLFVGTNELHLLRQCLLWSFMSNDSKLQSEPSILF